VVWTYAGVRPLLDDEAATPRPSRATTCSSRHPAAPLLSVWGGKITTFRKLAEEAPTAGRHAGRAPRRPGRTAPTCRAATCRPGSARRSGPTPTSSASKPPLASATRNPCISKKVGAQPWLYDMSLRLRSGAVTVLLGATQAGKTSLMRIMAGLDKPSTGQACASTARRDRLPVRERNVAMVYQQFINYPSMRVEDNIASPLKLRGERDIASACASWRRAAHRDVPGPLSGRALGRPAAARGAGPRAGQAAPLMLLDEPLVNLDYKLREELRDELTQLFAAGDSTVVYATTEPAEALLLGGYTAVLDAGELLQYGPRPRCSMRPKSLRVARAFSDPPMNLMPAETASLGVRCRPGRAVDPAAGGRLQGADARRARQRAAGAAAPGDVALPGRVELAEISGSDTFVHVRTAAGAWWRSSPACTTSSWARRSRCTSPGAGPTCSMPPGDLLVAPQRAPGDADMARIDLDLAHAYRPNRAATRTTRCCR
jgi:glycerol transport system ATP-binding protein